MAQRKHRQNVTAASGHPKHRHDNSSQAKDDTVDPSVFYTCPWVSSQIPYLLYRLLMAGGVLYYIWCDVLYMGVGFLLWLSLASNWSLILLAVYFTWGTALCAAHRPVQVSLPSLLTHGLRRSKMLPESYNTAHASSHPSFPGISELTGPSQ
uniref:Uncharacterized protein n=1 Tax=Branchiostoma floridae TaxID=7739 RepID=C3XUG4_BRAFL|eukprot:XP_002612529.1 hypothetical protein BRAFLDRAFT_75349 [Branchiostoma floridae]